MGYIEDTRKLMQDFLAPELRAISVRLDALEELVKTNERGTEQRFSDLGKQLAEAEARGQQRAAELEDHTTQRFSELERHTDQRFSDLERHTDQRFSDLELHTDQRFSELGKQLSETEARSQQRLAELEHHTDQRLFEYERRAEQRHSETLNAISMLSNYQVVLERLARLEGKQNVSAA